MFTWPVDTARRMSGCLMSEPLECTTISSLPPVALLTSSTNILTLRVWNSPSEYGVGMSHLVCASATPKANMRANALRAIMEPPRIGWRILA
jgi:hypothetical protein